MALRVSEAVERKLLWLGIAGGHLDAAGRLGVDVHANKAGLVWGRADIVSLENWPNTRGLGHRKRIHLHSCRQIMSFVGLYWVVCTMAVAARSLDTWLEDAYIGQRAGLTADDNNLQSH